MDPMCAWCYAFEPELKEFISKYSFLEIDYIMGGLAPDNNKPMDEDLKRVISSYLVEIEKKTRVVFNHDYWKFNTPYCSTYLACRAIIVGESLKEKSSYTMVKAIQSDYYKEAKNPSFEETLIACANSISLDENQFLEVFKSEETQQHLQEHLSISAQLKVSGFPSLFYINNMNRAYPLSLGFTNVSSLANQFNKILEISGKNR